MRLDDVISALRTVKHPVSGQDVASMGIIKNLKVEGSKVSFRANIQTSSEPLRKQTEDELINALKKAGATAVEIELPEPQAQAQGHSHGQKQTQVKNRIPGVGKIIAVSSGKGGVGKSTVSSNLAVTLAKLGFKVGLLDTDVYGPNVPTMLGVSGPPEARLDPKRGELILPMDAHGLKVMSMGLLAPTEDALIWRGPMLHSVVSQFLFKVDWGTLDYLVIDMPPGTGDVQLSLAQLVEVDGAVVVTTPQEVSCQDVRRAIQMFEKVNVPILGVVENMSYFVCDSCEERHEIFGRGAGHLLSDKFKTKLLAQLPLQAAVRDAGDKGDPIVAADPDGTLAQAFFDLGKSVQSELSRAGTRAEIGEF